MKFKKFLKDPNAPVIITEADIFPDVDVIKLDPDRADAHDIVQALMPTLVRMAYVYLSEDKVKYERTHNDPDDTPFEFTEDALEEHLDLLIENITKRLDDQSSHDKKAAIDHIAKEFKAPLTESLSRIDEKTEVSPKIFHARLGDAHRAAQSVTSDDLKNLHRIAADAHYKASREPSEHNVAAALTASEAAGWSNKSTDRNRHART